jgi:predicted alpha/beta superfamily hydrolase
MHRTVFRLLFVFLVALPTRSKAQAVPGVAIPATREYEMRAASNGRRYRLFVALPERYSADDTTRYPVLYVVDGIAFFRVAIEEQRMLRFAGAVGDVIIVGVDYDVPTLRETQAPRYRDFTPSRDSAADASFARRVAAGTRSDTVRSGGAATFFGVLAAEIIPFVDARVRTTADRGLWGHSLGGLFALHVLLEHPGLFGRYAISSPALAWNGRESVAREAAYARTHDALPARVFLSVGADEGPELFTSFVSTLAARRYRQLELSSHVFDGETHASVVPSALSRSLRFLYPPPQRR